MVVQVVSSCLTRAREREISSSTTTREMRCSAKRCGVLTTVERGVRATLDAWHEERRLFLGIDVSTVVCGVCVLSADPLRLVRVERSQALVLRSAEKRITGSGKSGIAVSVQLQDEDLGRDRNLFARMDMLQAAFTELKSIEQDPVTSDAAAGSSSALGKKKINPWTISIEDKLLRVQQGKKGIIGLYSLAEVHVASRLACRNVFGVEPVLVHPSTARSRMGLKAEAGENAKELVISLVNKLEPGMLATKVKSELKYVNDRADAYIIAMYAMRHALCAELLRNEHVVRAFRACHLKHVSNPVQLESELASRLPKWVDEIFFHHERFEGVF